MVLIFGGLSVIRLAQTRCNACGWLLLGTSLDLLNCVLHAGFKMLSN
jgi:hypothetical protein